MSCLSVKTGHMKSGARITIHHLCNNKCTTHTDLKLTTGPTSEKISLSCSSDASYGIFPTKCE